MVGEEVRVVDQVHLSWFKVLSRYSYVQLFIKDLKGDNYLEKLCAEK